VKCPEIKRLAARDTSLEITGTALGTLPECRRKGGCYYRERIYWCGISRTAAIDFAWNFAARRGISRTTVGANRAFIDAARDHAPAICSVRAKGPLHADLGLQINPQCATQRAAFG
jgi:hypothetical protein